MKRKVFVCAAAVWAAWAVAPRAGWAEPASVLSVKVYAQGLTGNPPWVFQVEAQHTERAGTTKHFCDSIRVATPDGKTLKDVKFKRGHGGRPFTGAVSGVRLPSGGAKVMVEAHCTQDGWAGRKVMVDLSQPKGEGFEVVRGDALKAHIQTLVRGLYAESTKDMKGLMLSKKNREELQALGRVVVPDLIEVLNGDNPQARWAALMVLGSLGDKRAIDGILKCYDDRNGLVRSVAVRQSRRFLSDPRVLDATLAKLSSRGGEKKWAAEALLANRSSRPKAIAKLVELCSHEQAGVRGQAFTALTGVDKTKARDKAVAAVKSEKAIAVRSAAMQYLIAAQDKRPDTIAAFKTLLKSSEPQLRGEGFSALVGLAPKDAYAMGFDLLKTEKDGRVRRGIVHKMYYCPARDNRVVELLIAALSDPDVKTRGICYRILKGVTGQAFPFHADVAPEYRARSVKRWHEWWEQNKATFKLKPIQKRGGRR